LYLLYLYLDKSEIIQKIQKVDELGIRLANTMGQYSHMKQKSQLEHLSQTQVLLKECERVKLELLDIGSLLVELQTSLPRELQFQEMSHQGRYPLLSKLFLKNQSSPPSF
jgi:hypothetical protein